MLSFCLLFFILSLVLIAYISTLSSLRVLCVSTVQTQSIESIHSIQKIVKQSTSTNDPCATFDPVLPNYNAPGRRINEVKCDEYVWQRMIRAERTKKFQECIASQIKNGNGPYFAIGGRDALPGEFPHMGALGWKTAQGTWIFKCGGTLISPKFTLTAAHCSKAPPDPKTTSQVPQIVRFGDKNIIDVYSNGIFPTDAKIVRIILHPLYSAPSKYYDIALVELARELEFSSNVQPACLWNSFDTNLLGYNATLTGWGVIDTATKLTSPILQAAVVDIIDLDQCDRLLQQACNRWFCGIREHQICGGKLKGGVDACQGDSGGPLQVKIPLPPSEEGSMHFVIGVTSFGIGCARRNTPGVYTRVSSFVDWIESIVWPYGQ